MLYDKIESKQAVCKQAPFLASLWMWVRVVKVNSANTELALLAR